MNMALQQQQLSCCKSLTASCAPFHHVHTKNYVQLQRRRTEFSAAIFGGEKKKSRRVEVKASSSGSTVGWWNLSDKGSLIAPGVTISDVLWPSAGAFAAMALLGRLDQMVASKGLAFTIAPLGAVSAVLFTAPNSPAAQKYNMFMAQIGCAALGVVALTLFGPGWLARATALSASLAFMIITGTTHPPAASLPLLFIDGAKFHSLNYWYALFPGAAGCIILCLIQEIVTFLKQNVKF